MRRVALLLVLVSIVALPATALAQDNAFGPLPQAAQPTPTPTSGSTSTSDQSTVSRPLLLGIAGAVALVFLGIGVFITRDARAHLTEADRAAVEGSRRRDEVDRKQAERAKARARAKGKAQRQARKAHRKR
jgi:hypothetical protein